jgi:hypothetical protein
MIPAHYILWRFAGETSGPVILLYVIGMAGVTIVMVELVDRITKRIRKKK